MRLRLLALPALVGVACTPPPPPPAPKVVVTAPPPVTSAAPEPPEAPVTVSHRAAIAVQAMWLKPVWRDGVIEGDVRLWPSGERVKALFEVKGHFGKPFFLLPNTGSMRVSETGKVFQSGEPAILHDLSGAAAQSLGAWSHASFFERGTRLYVWNNTMEGVWDVAAGKLLAEQPLDAGAVNSGAYVAGDPPRLIREGEGILHVSELPSLRLRAEAQRHVQLSCARRRSSAVVHE